MSSTAIEYTKENRVFCSKHGVSSFMVVKDLHSTESFVMVYTPDHTDCDEWDVQFHLKAAERVGAWG